MYTLEFWNMVTGKRLMINQSSSELIWLYWRTKGKEEGAGVWNFLDIFRPYSLMLGWLIGYAIGFQVQDLTGQNQEIVLFKKHDRESVSSVHCVNTSNNLFHVATLEWMAAYLAPAVYEIPCKYQFYCLVWIVPREDLEGDVFGGLKQWFKWNLQAFA